MSKTSSCANNFPARLRSCLALAALLLLFLSARLPANATPASGRGGQRPLPAQQDDEKTKAALVGTWKSRAQASLILHGDGTGSLQVGDTCRDFTYSIKGIALVTTQGTEVTEYFFMLQPDTLILSGPGLQAPVSFERERSAETPDKPGERANPTPSVVPPGRDTRNEPPAIAPIPGSAQVNNLQSSLLAEAEATRKAVIEKIQKRLDIHKDYLTRSKFLFEAQWSKAAAKEKLGLLVVEILRARGLKDDEIAKIFPKGTEDLELNNFLLCFTEVPFGLYESPLEFIRGAVRLQMVTIPFLWTNMPTPEDEQKYREMLQSVTEMNEEFLNSFDKSMDRIRSYEQRALASLPNYLRWRARVMADRALVMDYSNKLESSNLDQPVRARLESNLESARKLEMESSLGQDFRFYPSLCPNTRLGFGPFQNRPGASSLKPTTKHVAPIEAEKRILSHTDYLRERAAALIEARVVSGEIYRTPSNSYLLLADFYRQHIAELERSRERVLRYRNGLEPAELDKLDEDMAALKQREPILSKNLEMVEDLEKRALASKQTDDRDRFDRALDKFHNELKTQPAFRAAPSGKVLEVLVRPIFRDSPGPPFEPQSWNERVLPRGVGTVISLFLDGERSDKEIPVELTVGGRTLKLSAKQKESSLVYETQAFMLTGAEGNAASTPAAEKKTANALDDKAAGSRIAGSWQVTYNDSWLGLIKGTAIVAPDGRSATVTFEDPRSKAAYTMTSTDVQANGDEYTMLFEGESPNLEGPVIDTAPPDERLPSFSEQLIANFTKSIRVEIPDNADKVTVRVGAGEFIGEKRIEPFGPPVDLNRVTLRLKLQTGARILRGTWRYRADPVSWRDRAGRGRVGLLTRNWANPNISFQHGQESWVKVTILARLQLFAVCVENLKKIDQLYMGVPTVVEVLFPEPQDKDVYDIEVKAGDKTLKVPTHRDPADFRRFLSEIFIPGDDVRVKREAETSTPEPPRMPPNREP